MSAPAGRSFVSRVSREVRVRVRQEHGEREREILTSKRFVTACDHNRTGTLVLLEFLECSVKLDEERTRQRIESFGSVQSDQCYAFMARVFYNDVLVPAAVAVVVLGRRGKRSHEAREGAVRKALSCTHSRSRTSYSKSIHLGLCVVQILEE